MGIYFVYFSVLGVIAYAIGQERDGLTLRKTHRHLSIIDGKNGA